MDTNIISEMMNQAPSKNVLNWINNQNPLSLFVSTITIAEILYGLQIKPSGQRKNILSERFNLFIKKAFEQRVLSFNESAAVHYSEIMAYRKELGQPMSLPDGQIAAIARSKNLNVATRNIRDFTNCGLSLINPFDS